MTELLDNLEDTHQFLTLVDGQTKQALETLRLHLGNDISPENRQNLNDLLENTGGILIEVCHILSSLKEEDQNNDRLIPQQRHALQTCQELCQRIKEDSREIISGIKALKEQMNEAGCPVLGDYDQEDWFQNSLSGFIPNKVSETLFQTYQGVRSILSDVHKELLLIDPENMMLTAGKRLEVRDGKTFFLNTEHEMNVMIDYGLFNDRKDGKNVVERHYDLHHSLYPPQKRAVLKAFKEARFSLLKIGKPVPDYGFVVYDPLLDESFLMIDKGLSPLAKTSQPYALLTYYLRLPDFALTTGAATHILLQSPMGERMQIIFERLLSHEPQKQPFKPSSSFVQGITDLYKTALHENLTQSVASRGLPFNSR